MKPEDIKLVISKPQNGVVANLVVGYIANEKAAPNIVMLGRDVSGKSVVGCFQQEDAYVSSDGLLTMEDTYFEGDGGLLFAVKINKQLNLTQGVSGNAKGRQCSPTVLELTWKYLAPAIDQNDFHCHILSSNEHVHSSVSGTEPFCEGECYDHSAISEWNG
eukprot:Nk52_evm4s351 gene=Nk52_evmTU4s351